MGGESGAVYKNSGMIGEKISMCEINKKSDPLVSIVIPCYNHEKYISDCINSILKQTYDNIEILICDDCSRDSSWQKLTEMEERLQKRFLHISLRRNPKNLGVVKNLNRMLKEAQGKYILELATDDFMEESAIEDFVVYCEENESIDVAVCNGWIVPDGAHFPLKSKDSDKVVYKSKVNFDLPHQKLLESLYQNNFIFTPGTFLRKQVFLDHGYYDETMYGEDWEYWLRLAEAGRSRFGYLDKCLIAYRQSDNSMTSLMNNDGFEKRYLKLYEFQSDVMEKYKDKVSANVHASTKMHHIIDANKLACKCQMESLLKITQLEFKEYKVWRNLPMRDYAFFLKNVLLHRVRL